jgi:hypothetical protein
LAMGQDDMYIPSQLGIDEMRMDVLSRDSRVDIAAGP